MSGELLPSSDRTVHNNESSVVFAELPRRCCSQALGRNPYLVVSNASTPVLKKWFSESGTILQSVDCPPPIDDPSQLCVLHIGCGIVSASLSMKNKARPTPFSQRKHFYASAVSRQEGECHHQVARQHWVPEQREELQELEARKH
jgi:hypothetical protein